MDPKPCALERTLEWLRLEVEPRVQAALEARRAKKPCDLDAEKHQQTRETAAVATRVRELGRALVACAEAWDGSAGGTERMEKELTRVRAEFHAVQEDLMLALCPALIIHDEEYAAELGLYGEEARKRARVPT
jgi:hypothetical protein